MAKGGKKRSRNTASGWTASDHDAQLDKKQRKQHQKASIKAGPNRTALLTHNTQEKRDARKLQLHIAKVQRELNELKERLSNWDPVREAQRKKERLQKELQEQEAASGATGKKRKGRLGPESWKLRGAARPAWEVYDFDTRYVDPHAQAHEQAAATASRSQHLLRTRASDGSLLLHSVAPEEAREYLKLLMQLGYLSQEAKQYKTARAAFLECIDLEGDDDDDNAHSSAPSTILTSAREACMRMYLELERYDAAYRLGERFSKDTSCVIRFSMAALAVRLQKDAARIHSLMLQAIRCNVFATLYLCHYETFVEAMEYTEELQDADDEPQSTLEEALEYCSSPYAALWQQTDGAIEHLQRSFQDDTLTPGDREWKDRLAQIEARYRSRTAEQETDESDAPVQGIDILMYAGMFRTAMDMVEDPSSF